MAKKTSKPVEQPELYTILCAKGGEIAAHGPYASKQDALKCVALDPKFDNLESVTLVPTSSCKLVRLMTVKVCVGCESEDGPDLFYVRVRCTELDYSEGAHYSAAVDYVKKNYVVDKPFWVCDEHDPAGCALMKHMVWSGSTLIRIPS